MDMMVIKLMQAKDTAQGQINHLERDTYNDQFTIMIITL